MEISNEQQQSLSATRRPAAPPARSRPESANLDDLLEFLISWSQDTFGVDDLVGARDEFWVQTGKAFTADPFYDARISYFFDHYLFERPIVLDDLQATPYQHYLRRLDQGLVAPLPEDLESAVRALGAYRHSFFQILKVQDKSMTIEDLLEKRRLLIRSKGDEIFAGIEKKNIFQGFVFRNGEVAHLSQGFVLHPVRIAGLLKRHLKIHKKAKTTDQLPLLFKLASLHIRHLRHKHVDPKTIYKP